MGCKGRHPENRNCVGRVGWISSRRNLDNKQVWQCDKGSRSAEHCCQRLFIINFIDLAYQYPIAQHFDILRLVRVTCQSRSFFCRILCECWRHWFARSHASAEWFVFYRKKFVSMRPRMIPLNSQLWITWQILGWFSISAFELLSNDLSLPVSVPIQAWYHIFASCFLRPSCQPREHRHIHAANGATRVWFLPQTRWWQIQAPKTWWSGAPLAALSAARVSFSRRHIHTVTWAELGCKSSWVTRRTWRHTSLVWKSTVLSVVLGNDEADTKTKKYIL